jgi:hypothetical protein
MTLGARPERAGLDPEGHSAALGAANKAARDDPPGRDPKVHALYGPAGLDLKRVTKLPWAQPTRQLAMILQVAIRKGPRSCLGRSQQGSSR